MRYLNNFNFFYQLLTGNELLAFILLLLLIIPMNINSFPPNSFISIIYWYYKEFNKFETTLKLFFVIFKIGQISAGWQNWRSSSNYENFPLVPISPLTISDFSVLLKIFLKLLWRKMFALIKTLPTSL